MNISLNNTNLNFKGTIIATDIIKNNERERNANVSIDSDDVLKIEYAGDKQTIISQNKEYLTPKGSFYYRKEKLAIPYNIDRVLAAYTACKDTSTEIQL